MRRLSLLLFLCLFLGLGSVSYSGTAGAEPVRPFSPIFVNGKDLGVIGFVPLEIHINDYRLNSVRERGTWAFLRELQAYGYKAFVVGSTSSQTAPDFVLSGTIIDYRCVSSRGDTCGIEVEWQLHNAHSRHLLYRVLVRHEEKQLDNMTQEDGGTAVLLGALDSLLSRAQFSERMEHSFAPAPLAPVPASAQPIDREIGQCAVEAIVLPDAAENVAPALLRIEAAQGAGTGSFVSDDGYFVTAAHLALDDTFQVVLSDGGSQAAEVVTLDEKRDLVLARLVDRTQKTACFRWKAGEPEAFETFYVATLDDAGAAIVAPGKVTGDTLIDDSPFMKLALAVDASYSGGPVLDGEGRVRGILSEDITGMSAPDVRFAVPSQQVISGLSLRRRGAKPPVTVAPRTPTKIVSIDDVSDPEWEYVQDGAPETERRWVRPVRTAGWVLSGVGTGLAIVGASYSGAEAPYGFLIGGAMIAGVGVGLVINSYISNKAHITADESAQPSSSQKGVAIGFAPSVYRGGGGAAVVGAF